MAAGARACGALTRRWDTTKHIAAPAAGLRSRFWAYSLNAVTTGLDLDRCANLSRSGEPIRVPPGYDNVLKLMSRMLIWWASANAPMVFREAAAGSPSAAKRLGPVC